MGLAQHPIKAGRGRGLSHPKGMNKGQDKQKNSFDPKEKASDTAASPLSQTVDPATSKTPV